MELIIIASLIICLLLAVILLNRKTKEAKYYHEEWSKWESEYWYLRQSKAIKDGYIIHLSWLPRGFGYAITEPPQLGTLDDQP